MTPLICVLLAEKVYYICFGQKRSCLHIGFSVLRWLVIHLLDINQLIFDYAYIDAHSQILIDEYPVDGVQKHDLC